MLVKQCIPRHIWVSAQEFLRTVNGDPHNRGTAVAGKGAMMPRLRGNGTLSKRMAVPESVMQLIGAKADNLGYFDYVDDADRRKVSCRETNWTISHPEVLQGVLPYILEIDALFKACLPDEYAVQWAEVAKVAEAYRFWRTVFTTLTGNKNLRTFLHIRTRSRLPARGSSVRRRARSSRQLRVRRRAALHDSLLPGTNVRVR